MKHLQVLRLPFPPSIPTRHVLSRDESAERGLPPLRGVRMPTPREKHLSHQGSKPNIPSISYSGIFLLILNLQATEEQCSNVPAVPLAGIFPPTTLSTHLPHNPHPTDSQSHAQDLKPQVKNKNFRHLDICLNNEY